jgi:hypothetical protein
VVIASFVHGGPDADAVGFDDVALDFGAVVALGTAELQAAKAGMTSPHPINAPTFECLVARAGPRFPEGPRTLTSHYGLKSVDVPPTGKPLGGVSPTCDHARNVGTRPRAVRWINPHCRRKGS